MYKREMIFCLWFVFTGVELVCFFFCSTTSDRITKKDMVETNQNEIDIKHIPFAFWIIRILKETCYSRGHLDLTFSTRPALSKTC